MGNRLFNLWKPLLFLCIRYDSSLIPKISVLICIATTKKINTNPANIKGKDYSNIFVISFHSRSDKLGHLYFSINYFFMIHNFHVLIVVVSPSFAWNIFVTFYRHIILGPKVGKIGHKWEKSATLWAKMYRNLIWKNPG